MTKITPLLTALLLWGSCSFANLPSDDAQMVSQWAGNLNAYYTDLRLVPAAPSSSEVINQMQYLEEYLRGDRPLENGSLTLLACDRCVCIGCSGAE